MYSNNTYLKPLDQFQWFLFFVSLQHGTTLYPSVPDLDLEIRGTQSSIPLDKGGGGFPNKIFSALQAPVWSKNKGGLYPPLDLPMSLSHFFHFAAQVKEWQNII